jgi:hypothetical protein
MNSLAYHNFKGRHFIQDNVLKKKNTTYLILLPTVNLDEYLSYANQLSIPEL